MNVWLTNGCVAWQIPPSELDEDGWHRGEVGEMRKEKQGA